MSFDIRISKAGYGFDFDLAIFLHNHEGRIAYIAKPIRLEFEPIQPGQAIKESTLHLSGHEGEDFMRAMAECCHREKIQPPEPHRLEGEIEATKRHLEDLRMLLKLRKP